MAPSGKPWRQSDSAASRERLGRALKRIFVGWDRPLVEKVSGYLLGGRSGTVDLNGVLTVVPTREAGRKLRRAMALFCSGTGGGLLSARIVTPPFFLFPARVPPDVAGAAAEQVVWAELLDGVDLERYPALFPRPVAEGERASWAFRTGETIEALRRRLLEAGLTIADVCRRAGSAFEEAERWEELKRLETEYLGRLEAQGFRDRVSFIRAYAARPEVPPGVERIVVAGCPDPQPVAMGAVEALAQRCDVEVLVHAPGELSDRFDAWGRPLAGCWAGTEDVVTGGKSAIRVAETPAEQAEAVVDVLSADNGGEPKTTYACGTADSHLVPVLRRCLGRSGVDAFDPAGHHMKSHPMYGLLSSFCSYLAGGSYESLAVLMRQKYLVEHLRRRGLADPERVLIEMDRLQNAVLPVHAADVRSAIGRSVRDGGGMVENVAAALGLVDELAALFRGRPFAAALRRLLAKVCGGRKIRLREAGGREFLQVARIVDECLGELESGLADATRASEGPVFEVFLRLLAEKRIDGEREEGSVALEGWLELPWTDAGSIVVAGFNEGSVPEGLPADPYLPDSLRVAVGLRSDADRTARDAYLARSLLESRPPEGRVVFVLGRQSMEGDPLLPSRLLFAGDPRAAAERALELFAPLPERPRAPLPPGEAVLDPWKLKKSVPPRLHATDFRLYMECPFRFYLKRILVMEGADDLKEELDALDYGHAVHYSLQGLAERAYRSETGRSTLEAMLWRRCDNWLDRRFGGRISPAVAIQAASLKKRLSGAAAAQSRLASEGWEVAEAEIDVELEVGGIAIGGRIDRIDRHRESGRYRIIDYKTTDRRGDPEDAHTAGSRADGDYGAPARRGRARSWKDLQLPLYREMALRGLNIPDEAVVGIFYLPAAGSETGLVLWEVFGEEHRLSSLACATAVIDRIRRGVFWPPAEKVAWDEYDFFGASLSRIMMPSPGGGEDAGT